MLLSTATIMFDFSEIQSTCDKNMLNKTVSDIMNAATSHKCRSTAFSDGITSKKNYENLIVQIRNFIIENDKQREKCPNTGKYGPEITPYLDTFHAVTLAI